MRKDFKERYETVFGRKRLLLAVSGGMDSMCVLNLSTFLTENIYVVYFDHSTREGGSTQDGKMVNQYCFQHGIDFRKEVYNHNSGNFQEQARNFRYKKLEEYRQKLSIDFILTGHHQDDHIESFLMQIMRGSGLNNNQGITDRDHYHRPMIHYSRKEVQAYVHAQCIPYVEDNSNKDAHYLRNYLRNNFLDTLYKSTPHARAGLLASINNYQSDTELLEYLLDNSLKINDNQIKLTDISRQPFRSRFLYHKLSDSGITMDQCKNIFTAETGAVFHTPSHNLYIDRGMLHILPAVTEEPVSISIPAIGKYTYGRDTILISMDEHNSDDRKGLSINFEELKFPLVIRPWKPGDSFKPIKLKGKSTKIKKYFVEHKIPLFHKSSIPILATQEDEIVAVLGYEVSYDYKALENTAALIVYYPF